MSKVKLLHQAHERYDITVDATATNNPEKPYGAKASVTILNDVNAPTIRATGESFGASSFALAEEEALDTAIERVLGKGALSKLKEQFQSFDISSGAMSTGKKDLPYGVKVNITTFDQNGKVIRKAQGVGMGTDPVEVEKEALKNAVNRTLGVK